MNTVTINIPKGVTAVQVRNAIQQETTAICVAIYDMRETELEHLRREWDEGMIDLKDRHPEIEW